MVEIIQCNMSNPIQMPRAFEGDHFDYVICLAAETKYGQIESSYRQNTLECAVNVARYVEETKPIRMIYLSTAQVYDPSKGPSDETKKLNPWTNVGKFHKMAEDELRGQQIPLIILRPSFIYGPDGFNGVGI